jgi:cytochrome c oxidase assembly protein Cox11
MKPEASRRRRANIRVLVPLGIVLAIMVTLTSYSVTLYRLFCSATGWTTQRVAADTAAVSDRIVTVRFSTDVDASLPWRFEPEQHEVKVHLGEQALVYFTAQNLSDKPLVAHATYNVTPIKAGYFFDKIQCFCFNEEKLAPGEKVEMPVDFFVSPDLDKDVNARDVTTITLAYTFFPSRSPDGAEDLARFDQPDPARGRELFTERCAACHALGSNKTGPLLGGVVGRKAATIAGYRYSSALAAANLVWSAETLDKWLAGPQAFVPGARMPVSVPQAAARRDLIAYLEQIGAQAVAAPARPAQDKAPPPG